MWYESNKFMYTAIGPIVMSHIVFVYIDWDTTVTLPGYHIKSDRHIVKANSFITVFVQS